METNNKLREALIKIRDLTEPCEGVTEVELIINDIAISALAAPARNCDVGTEQEQAERYVRYCDMFTRDGMHCETCPCCGKIPFGKCEFAWAQMPYEGQEGGAK